MFKKKKKGKFIKNGIATHVLCIFLFFFFFKGVYCRFRKIIIIIFFPFIRRYLTFLSLSVKILGNRAYRKKIKEINSSGTTIHASL